MSLFRVVLVSALLMLTSACGGYSSSPAAPSTPATGGTSSPVTIPRGAESLANRAYSPDDLNIAVGETVTWTNTDSVAHTSTSNAGAWNSGTVAPGGQFSFTFQNAGAFPYHCTIHPGMVGTVVVR